MFVQIISLFPYTLVLGSNVRNRDDFRKKEALKNFSMETRIKREESLKTLRGGDTKDEIRELVLEGEIGAYAWAETILGNKKGNKELIFDCLVKEFNKSRDDSDNARKTLDADPTKTEQKHKKGLLIQMHRAIGRGYAYSDLLRAFVKEYPDYKSKLPTNFPVEINEVE